MIRVGLIGYGYWGPNLLRNLRSEKRFQVTAVADSRAERIADLPQTVNGLTLFDSGEALIRSGLVDAVVIATPVASHYPLARLALDSGLHVMVEKPLCSSVAEGEELVALATSRDLALLVDHTFLFTGAVKAIKRLRDDGELGTLSYFDSMRINLGLFQPDVNVLWDLGVHDLSILDHVVGADPLHVEASGHCHVNPNVPDIVFLTLHFANDFVAHLNLSWMSPVKVRRVAIGGSRKMLVWDDLDQEQKIRIYDAGISFQAESERAMIIPEYRIGDIVSPRIPVTEPLAGVIRQFADSIETRAPSMIDGVQGLRVVRLLEMAQQRLDENLAALAKHKATWAGASS